MNKTLHLEPLNLHITVAETILFVLLIGWIAASFFVPLPEVNSLGA